VFVLEIFLIEREDISQSLTILKILKIFNICSLLCFIHIEFMIANQFDNITLEIIQIDIYFLSAFVEIASLKDIGQNQALFCLELFNFILTHGAPLVNESGFRSFSQSCLICSICGAELAFGVDMVAHDGLHSLAETQFLQEGGPVLLVVFLPAAVHLESLARLHAQQVANVVQVVGDRQFVPEFRLNVQLRCQIRSLEGMTPNRNCLSDLV